MICLEWEWEVEVGWPILLPPHHCSELFIPCIQLPLIVPPRTLGPLLCCSCAASTAGTASAALLVASCLACSLLTTFVAGEQFRVCHLGCRFPSLLIASFSNKHWILLCVLRALVTWTIKKKSLQAIFCFVFLFTLVVCNGDPALSRIEIRVSLLAKAGGLLLYGVLNCNPTGLLL